MGFAIAVLCVVLVSSACGGDDAEPSNATSSPGATAITTESPAPNATATQAPSPAATVTPEPGVTPGTVQASGVRGVALVGPSCPVQREDEPCPDRPWQGTVLAKTLAGAEVASTASDAEGRFEIELAAGEYELIAEPGGFLPAPISLYVTVVQGQVLEVELMLDSGIR
jgi:hypothetical protein